MSTPTLNLLQVIGCVLALALQLIATISAQPLRRLLSSRVWSLLMMLNLLIFARRFISLMEIGFGWHGADYQSTVVVVGLAVSLFMMGTVVHLRRFVGGEREKALDLAHATVKLAEEKQAKDSLAYQLALHFIRLREEREDLAVKTAHDTKRAKSASDRAIHDATTT